MKLLAICLSALVLSIGLAHAADPVLANGDFSKGLEGWKLTMPEEVGAKLEVVEDGYEGKPALKLVVGDTELEPWQGRLSVDAKFEPGASYTLTFMAMSEPDDSLVEVVPWGRNAADKNAALYGSRQNFRPTQSWEEFSVQFVVDADAKETYGITFGNLARANRTTWLANVTVTKE